MSGGRKTPRLAVLCGWSLRSRGVVGHIFPPARHARRRASAGGVPYSSIPVHGERTPADLRGVTRLPGGTTWRRTAAVHDIPIPRSQALHTTLPPSSLSTMRGRPGMAGRRPIVNRRFAAGIALLLIALIVGAVLGT